MHLSSFIVLLAVVCSGCLSRDTALPAASPTHEPSVASLKPSPAPLLSTADVQRIACEVLRTNAPGLAGYSCKTVAFGGDAADPNISNKWIVRFAPKIEAPDSDVFVIIEDGSGEAKMWRWSAPKR